MIETGARNGKEMPGEARGSGWLARPSGATQLVAAVFGVLRIWSIWLGYSACPALTFVSRERNMRHPDCRSVLCAFKRTRGAPVSRRT